MVRRLAMASCGVRGGRARRARRVRRVLCCVPIGVQRASVPPACGVQSERACRERAIAPHREGRFAGRVVGARVGLVYDLTDDRRLAWRGAGRDRLEASDGGVDGGLGFAAHGGDLMDDRGKIDGGIRREGFDQFGDSRVQRRLRVGCERALLQRGDDFVHGLCPRVVFVSRRLPFGRRVVVQLPAESARTRW